MPGLGKMLVLAGLGIIILGLLIWFFGNKLHWFGNLPGDVRYESKNVRVYFPWVTMLIVSVLLSLVMYLVRRFLN